MSQSLAAGTPLPSAPLPGSPVTLLRRLPGLRQSAFGIALALLAFAGLVATLLRFDAPVTLAAMVLLAGGAALVLMPNAATLLMVFLLYTNIPAVAARDHGVPRAVAAAFILLLAIPLARHALVRGERLRADRTFTGMLAFMGVLLLASLRARGIDFALDRIVTFAVEGLLLYWLVLNVVRDLPTLRQVLWTVLAAGALLGALTVYQEVTGSFDQQFGGLAHRNYESLVARNALMADPEDPAMRAQYLEVLQQHGGERSKRAEGPMEEPNRFAQILVVLLPIAAFAYRTSRSRVGRAAAMVAGLLMLGAIVYSFSRGGMLTVALLAVLAVFVKWIRPAHLAVAAIVFVATVSAVAPRAFERMVDATGVVSLFRGGQAQEVDGAVRGRMTEMLAAYQVFLDYPVLGVGPAQYRPYYSREYHQKNPRLVFRSIEGTRRAHTLYLEIAAELGIVGLTVFMAIVVLLMRELLAMRRQWAGHPVFADLPTAFLLSLVGYLSTAVFLHMAYERYFWFLLALAGASLAIARQARASSQVTGVLQAPPRVAARMAARAS